MKPQFDHVVRVHLYRIVIASLILGTVACGAWYFCTSDSKTEPLLAGMVTGLIVALIQYLLEWNEHREIETFKQLALKRILPHRDDKAHYQELLEGAQREILVLGNTASRLLEDFAHEGRPDSQALLAALGRGVKVKILLPQRNHLLPNDQGRADQAAGRMDELKAQFSSFECRYFGHPPVHSLMKIDDDCLVGPIFPHVRSKDSPTIHAYVNSPLVGEYLKYFETEWNNATQRV